MNNIIEHAKNMQAILEGIQSKHIELDEFIKSTDGPEQQWYAIVSAHQQIMNSSSGLFSNKPVARQMLDRLIPDLKKLADERKSFKERYLAFFVIVGNFSSEQIEIIQSLMGNADAEHVERMKADSLTRLTGLRQSMEAFHAEHLLLKHSIANINSQLGLILKQ
jgi:hypothetical protein